MKRLIAVSSLLALVLAGSGLFALDIPVGEEGGKFTLDMNAKYEFNIITDGSKDHDNDKTWITEYDDTDKQAKVSIGASYDGENYAFGVGAGFQQKFALAEATGDKEWYLDDAWGKYYLLDKQLWIRGGSMDGLWRIDTDPLNKNYGGDNGPGVQINFAPSAVTGLNVGVALPVPLAEKREIDNTPTYGNWGPAYPFANLAFGLRLNGTIPNLDIGTELDLLGNEPNNGKSANEADEKEGDFNGMNWHLTAVYTFAPVTVKAALVVEGIANGVSNAPDPLTSAGVRVIFDIPNAEGSDLDLGDPWVQFQMLPNVNNVNKDVTTLVKKESFKDMEVAFEWEPNYSLIKDEPITLKAFLKFGVNYKSWGVEATDDQSSNGLKVLVQPKLEFKFAPNATLAILDELTLVRQASNHVWDAGTSQLTDDGKKVEGIYNVIGFRFAFAF